MKVILKQDVKGSGKKGDVIEVSDGYAKNYLLKNGLAGIATSGEINELRQRQSAHAPAEECDRRAVDAHRDRPPARRHQREQDGIREIHLRL